MDGKPVHSPNHPIKESDRMAAALRLEKPAIAIYGGGYGYHIQSILDRIIAEKKTLRVFCIEPLAGIYSHPDIQSYFAGLKASAEKNNLELVYIQEAEFKLQTDEFEFFSHPFYKRHFPEKTENFIRRHLPSVNQRTALWFERTWFMNYTRNIDFLLHSGKNVYSIDSLKNKFQGKTVIFTGASPALEDLTVWLKKNRSHYILVSADTSAYFLIKNGITPDFILSIDPGRGTAFHFRDDIPESVPVITWPGGHSGIFEKKNPLYIYFSTFPLDQLFAGILGESVQENPTLNISGMAQALAVSLGAKLFFLAGTGFVSEAGKSHCRGTGYENYFVPLVSRKKPLESYQPGFYKNNVSVHDKKNQSLLLGHQGIKTEFINESCLPKLELLTGDSTSDHKPVSMNETSVKMLFRSEITENLKKQSGFTPGLFKRFLSRSSQLFK